MIALVNDNISEIVKICKKHHVILLYLFGSASLGKDFNDESDIDFLYEFDTRGIDFNDLKNAPYDYSDNFFDFKFALENILKRKIDLIQSRSFKNPYFSESVEKTKQLIYADNRFEEIIV